MASPTVLTFDAEGRAVGFDVWVDDLQLFLQCDSRDGVSLFDHTSCVSTAPAATADSTVRSQWTTRDAVARLAARSHLPPAEHAHFGQYKTAQSLYDAVVARYSSPSTAALSRLMLPYLFPDLAAFATVADLVAHLHTSDARYRAALAVAAVAEVVEGAAGGVVEEEEGVVVEVGVAPGVGALVQQWRWWRLRRRWWRQRQRWWRWRRRWCWSRSGGAGPCTYVLRSGARSGENVSIFDLDFDAILAAMYALADITGGDCYLSVPHDPGTAAAALGASAGAALGASASAAPGAGTSTLSGTAPTESLHTFTLESGASRSFFRDSTTLTPLSRPVAVSLADPSGSPVLAHSFTVLPCPAAPSGLLSGLHLPSFSTKLVSGADLQDAWVDQFTPGVRCLLPASRSSPASAPCSCRSLAHKTLLWHHRLGHPSLLRLRGMASRGLVSGLPRSLPPLPPGPAPTCVPCVEGRQRAAPHSSSFPPTEAPLQTLHMDVWGTARVCGQGHDCYFLQVVDDYSRYTTVFPLRNKGEVPEQNGIAERRIGMVMDVARTSMIHAAAPHFLWPFAVQYAAHQINLQPRVSLPETTPTLRWTGKVGDASAFRVWGSRAFVRDTTADNLSSHAVPCVFLGFPPDAPGWQFYHPTSRRVLSFQDVTFDESVSYYRLFPYCTASPPPPPLFLAPGTPPVDPLPPQGPAPSGVSQVDLAEPVEVAVDSGAESGGAEPAGAGTGGAESGGAESWRAVPGGAELGVEHEGAASGGAEPARVESGGALGVPSRREPLSPQRLREWYSRRCRRATGATGGAARATGVAASAGGAGATGGAAAAGGAAGDGGAGAAGGAAATGGAAGAGGAAAARANGGAAAAGAIGGAAAAGATGGAAGARGAAGATGVAGTAGGAAGAGAAAAGGAAGAGGAAAAGAAGGSAGARGAAGAAGGAGGAAGDPGAEGIGSVSAVSGGAARPRPHYVPLLPQVQSSPPSPSPPPFLSPPPIQSQSQLLPASPLPGPYSGPSGGLTERREPESRPVLPASHSASPVRAVRAGRVSCPRLPPAPGTHSMPLRPSTAPQRVPLPSPPASSLPACPDPESDSLRAASPTVARFLATADTDPLFESSAASALVAKLADFAAACRLVYPASLVAASASVSVCPPSVGGECALGTDVLEDRQEEFECFAASVPHLVSMLLAPEGDPDALDIPTPRSYAEAIEGPYSSQWQAAMDAEMASWKSTCTYVDEVPPPGANIVSGMWIFKARYLHVASVVQRFGFTYSSPLSTPLPTGHSLSAPPLDESVEPSGSYPELVGCLIYLMTCTRPDLAYPLSLLARYVAPGRHRNVRMLCFV
ncbi:unnamed protein product [Closterium sp. NIES-54]